MDPIELGLTLAGNYPKNIRAYSFQQNCGKWKGIIYLITKENKQEKLFESSEEQYLDTECSSVASLHKYIDKMINWVKNLEINPKNNICKVCSKRDKCYPEPTKPQQPMKLLPEITEMYLMIERNKGMEALDKAYNKLRKAEKKVLRREYTVFAIKGALDAIEHNLNVLERRKK